MRQRRRGWFLLVHGRKLSPAGAGACGGRLPLPGLSATEGFGRKGTNGMTNGNALRASALALAFALAVFATASVRTAAADISIIGKWQIVEAVPAPWSK